MPLDSEKGLNSKLLFSEILQKNQENRRLNTALKKPQTILIKDMKENTKINKEASNPQRPDTVDCN